MLKSAKMAAANLGIVVVGMGMAGQVRVRDLLLGKSMPQLQGVNCLGVVSRRDVDIEGVPKVSFDEALERSDVNAIFVCTENTNHEETAKKALQAGKHVLVEFPLAMSMSGLKELQQLAKEKGVTLYEENIALLTPQHGAMKQHMAEKTRVLVKGAFSLDSGVRGFDVKSDVARKGTPYFSGISNLQCFMDLFGDVTPVKSKMHMDEKGIEVEAELKTQSGGLATMKISRQVAEKMTRSKSIRYDLDDGTHLDSNREFRPDPSRPKEGLFMQDTIKFVQVVRGEVDNTYGEWLTSRSIEVACQLDQMAQEHKL